MNPTQYLQLVVETVATHGNRGNDHFVSAFSIAQQALQSGFSAPVMLQEAIRAKDQVISGLTTYQPGCDWFDVRTHAQYAFLVSVENTPDSVDYPSTPWLRDRNGKFITKGTIVHYLEGHYRVSAVFVGIQKVNLAAVFGDHIFHKKVALSEIYEDDAEWSRQWQASETYKSM